MSEEILKRIDELAAKLNTTGSHLWEVLTKQARIEAIEWICWASVWLLLAIFFGFGLRACWNRKDGDEAEFVIGMGVFCLVAMVVATGIGFGCLGGVPAMLLNPEYWALKEVLKAVGK